VFTKRITGLLTDEEYRNLQLCLIVNPAAGPVIPGAGGLRKVRVAARSQGKRGGARVIYYWVPSREQILLLLVYAKNEQANLTPRQARILAAMVKEEFARETGEL
ncbi:MAG TPA: hypothetical protein DCY80_12960, partial [Solibacterales bacterium]|nr:hypothetical protein [Bryobacterales bacterium]